MKLQTVHEAKYSGDHPIVVEIKQALEDGEPIDVQIEDRLKSKQAVQGIISAFGPPTQHDNEEGMTEVMKWDDFPGNRLQVIIQGGRTIIEMFRSTEIGNRLAKMDLDKKPTLLARMRRRQLR